MPGFIIKEISAVLDEQIRAMRRGHELIVDILKTPGLAEMLNDLRDPEFRKSVTADPLPEVRKRKVRLPKKGVQVSIREHLRGWEIEIEILEGQRLYIFGFSSMHGFFSK